MDIRLSQFKNLDSSVGVKGNDLANLVESPSMSLAGCEECAMVAFWDFDKDSNSHNCRRFFYVPYPKTRTIKSSEINSVEQFLYVGKNDEVFFFYEDSYMTMEKQKESGKEAKICIGIVDCELTQE